MLSGLIKLPMTYHMCTGTLLPEIYWAPFTEKCDQDNNSLEIATSMIYSVIFLLFGSAVVYESVKGKAQATQQIDHSCNVQVNNRSRLVAKNPLVWIKLRIIQA